MTSVARITCAADSEGSRVEPISLILGALLAGATTGVRDAAGAAVKDAYTGLRDALRGKFSDKPAADTAVEEYVADPQQWQPVLETYLRQVGADADSSVIAAAQSLMATLDADGAREGKYTVNLAGAQGVQVGDHNIQSNDFRSPA